MSNDHFEFSSEEVGVAIAYRKQNPRAISTTAPTNANFLIEIDGHFAATQVTFLPKQDWDDVKYKSNWRYTLCCAQASKDIDPQRIMQDVQSVLGYYFLFPHKHLTPQGVEDSNPHGFQGCRAGAEHILKRYKYNATTDPYVNLDEETTVIVDKIILRIKRGLRIRKQGTGIRANTPTQWYSKFAAGAVGLALQKNALGRKDLEDEIPKAILEQYFLNVIELVNSMVTALYHGSWGQEAYLLYHAFAGQYIMFKDISRLGGSRRLRARNYMIQQFWDPTSVERLPLLHVFDPAELLSNVLTIDYQKSNRFLGLPGLSNRHLSTALTEQITPCAMKMLGIHNTSKFIDKLVRDDSRSSTDEPVRENDHSNTSEDGHSEARLNTGYSQRKALPPNAKEASTSTGEASLTPSVVALPAYTTFQQPARLSMPNQAITADRYPGQMVMPLVQSSPYNGIPSYGTPDLCTGPGDAQVPDSLALSMPMTNPEWEYAYDVNNFSIYDTFYGSESLNIIH